jgi:hypothetical protein
MEQLPSSITPPPDLNWTVITTNLDDDDAGSHLGSWHPLFLAAAAIEILFLVTFLVYAAIINANPVCAAIHRSTIDRTAAPELLLLAAFLDCATIIDIMGTWRWEGGFHGGGVVEPEAVT